MPAPAATAATAARQAAVLFAVSGLLALLAIPAEADHRAGLAGVAAADLLSCVLALLPLWRRLPVRAALLLAVPGLAVIAASASLDLVPVHAYGTFFVLVFAWVGAHQRPWTSLVLVPFTALAYVLPLLPDDADPSLDPRALVMTVLVGVLVAETIARAALQVRESRERADRSALLFRAVSRAGAALKVDQPTAVLEEVSAAIMEMGYDGASLALIDARAGTSTPSHGRGLGMAVDGKAFPVEGSVTALVRDARQPLVTRDYQSSPHAVPAIRDTGVRTAIAVPVYADRRLAAVLHAMSRRVVEVHDEDIEALRLLAASAGAGLEMSARLESAQATSARHAEAAMTDPLTRVGNRRLADQLLAELRPGDSVVLLDLDHFKDVNDSRGHAEGDKVLASFAAHLSRQVRMGDSVIRYGGEEFLLLLPATPLELAQKIVGRLLQAWRDTAPATTASAGLAKHAESLSASDTLRAADVALYRAKHEGRDRQAAAPDVRQVV